MFGQKCTMTEPPNTAANKQRQTTVFECLLFNYLKAFYRCGRLNGMILISFSMGFVMPLIESVLPYFVFYSNFHVLFRAFPRFSTLLRHPKNAQSFFLIFRQQHLSILSASFQQQKRTEKFSIVLAINTRINRVTKSLCNQQTSM